MKWETVSNGHRLTITMDTENLVKCIDERIKKFQSIDPDDDDERWERGRVYGDPEDDFLTPAECIADLEDMKDTINKMAADSEGTSLWPMVSLKKNGTFKRSVKPMLQQESFGPYWEDSYGWNVEVLRIEPINDVEAEIVLTDIVTHY